ncbi:FH1/FH2 domain-containing protein 3-like isoform X2 [Lytechinus variegatus]|uniref:FH1/FH2 domain-containing protein 3-like isoform X2 n=1 Tax=Lytechinus variegatus TaxID=7654 RepID=UPI001BB0E9B1|nr:FH1/FH2 domain-containing protein 3-like isoform X2 [Lytechinus variegatus]
MHKQLQQQQEKSEDQKEKTGPRGDVSGKISQAIEGIKVSNVAPKAPEPVAPKEDESKKEEEAWEEVLKLNDRELRVNKWDFTDLCRDDDKDVLKPIPLMMGIVPHMTAADGAPPPPPVPGLGGPPPPPPVPGAPPPPPAIGGPGAPPPPPPVIDSNTFPKSKKKKTVRLFWKETQPETMTLGRNGIKSTIWTQLDDVNLDSKKLEHLFEYRGKDLITKKAMEANKKNFITVLDPKKSNAINIGLTVLPQPRSIKQAILNMDSMVMNKEGVEKLLSMVPSEEEVARIQEAMLANPDVPLGSAEQFLHMLSTISGLEARLNLWLFKMDYDNMEEEVAEPMADLKKGIEDLRESKTFKKILSTLLAIGNFLNGGRAAGFNLEYLSKVPEVKDTVHKQSLLHHLCATVMEQFPDSSDFFSEVGTISRCAKVDFDQLTINLAKLEEQCKVSWDHLQVISQHEKTSQNKNKLHDFLQDCAKRIIVLKIVHRRVSNRFNKFLLYLGMSTSAAREVKISDFCRIISEFALEYRSARERIIEQEKKKANHRKRNKTRGKMITENFSISKDSAEDAKLKELLSTQQGTAPGDETLQSRQRARPSMSGRLNMSMTADEEVADEQTDEMIQILVNTAKNTSSRSAPRERKRTRNTNRKSLRRTLKSGLTDAERQALGLLHAKSSEVHV